MIRTHRPGEEGFVLVIALMIMVILSLIGIAGLQTSTMEQQVAGNDWNRKRTFYRADGGVSVGEELIEQNINCAPGFSTSEITDSIYAKEKKMYTKDVIDPDNVDFDSPTTDADVVYPWDGNGAEPDYDVGYFYIGGETSVLPGGALQMAAGYEGKGKGAGQGGVAKAYDIYSQFLGPKNSEAIVVVGWRHLVGQEGSCNY